MFLILGMGGAWYFRTVVQDTEDNAEFEMNQSQEIIQTYIERRYEELTAMGMRPGKEFDDQMGAYMYRMIPSSSLVNIIFLLSIMLRGKSCDRSNSTSTV